MGKAKVLVVPVDFSPLSKRALRAAMEMARLTPAEIHLLHVIPEYEVDSAFNIHLPGRSEVEAKASKWAKKAFEKYLAGEELADLPLFMEVRYGKPAQIICGYATEIGADLIIIASHGRSGFDRAVFGSVAEKVLRLGEHPVMVVKGQ